jgi:hypothetical protein
VAITACHVRREGDRGLRAVLSHPGQMLRRRAPAVGHCTSNRGAGSHSEESTARRRMRTRTLTPRPKSVAQIPLTNGGAEDG